MKKTVHEKLVMCQTPGELRRMLDGIGHVIVPKIPTPDMLQCGSRHYTTDFLNNDGTWGVSESIYKAMVAASPTSETGDE